MGHTAKAVMDSVVVNNASEDLAPLARTDARVFLLYSTREEAKHIMREVSRSLTESIASIRRERRLLFCDDGERRAEGRREGRWEGTSAFSWGLSTLGEWKDNFYNTTRWACLGCTLFYEGHNVEASGMVRDRIIHAALGNVTRSAALSRGSY